MTPYFKEFGPLARAGFAGAGLTTMSLVLWAISALADHDYAAEREMAPAPSSHVASHVHTDANPRRS